MSIFLDCDPTYHAIHIPNPDKFFAGRTHIAGRIASPRSIEPHRNALKSIKSIKSIRSAQFDQKRNKIAMHLLCLTL
ncbi:hypothetical protein N657DRAFT_644561, partial [Parathielavia appendiculata]